MSKGIHVIDPASSLNIIADIAGRFDELMELIPKMPPGLIILLGDLNDRGRQSKEVIEWAMKTPNVITLNSNHGDMFVDFVEGTGLYGSVDFLVNGGIQTLQSYGGFLVEEGGTPYGHPKIDVGATRTACLPFIDMSHIAWLKNLPYYYEQDGLFVSHAPRNPTFPMERLCVRGPELNSILWNRGNIRDIPGVFQVYGHNSSLQWHMGRGGDPIGVCIDDCRNKVLTGLHWPTKELFKVGYRELQSFPKRPSVDQSNNRTQTEVKGSVPTPSA